MKANGKFFGFTFILNLILGTIGFLILWGIRALTSEAIASYIICGALFGSFAVAVNSFIVTRSKLKKPYLLFGTFVNIMFLAGLTIITLIV